MNINDEVKIVSGSWNNKYINSEFKKWLIDHKDDIFKVQKINGTSIKLYKVNFWIGEEFLCNKEIAYVFSDYIPITIPCNEKLSKKELNNIADNFRRILNLRHGNISNRYFGE